MPAGDPQRVWFPMMLEALERTWSKSMTWDELADFCQRMTVERKAFRLANGIKPPRIRCPKCGEVTSSDIKGVSIRSALFALKKVGVVEREEFKELERSWKKHRREHDLDRFGRVAQAVPEAGGSVDLDK